MQSILHLSRASTTRWFRSWQAPFKASMNNSAYSPAGNGRFPPKSTREKVRGLDLTFFRGLLGGQQQLKQQRQQLQRQKLEPQRAHQNLPTPQSCTDTFQPHFLNRRPRFSLEISLSLSLSLWIRLLFPLPSTPGPRVRGPSLELLSAARLA